VSRFGRFAAGFGVAAVAIVIAAWFDGTVMQAAQQESAGSFDLGPEIITGTVGFVLIGGGALVIALTGWRVRSLSLAIAYMVVGGFFVLLEVIVWRLASEINGARPVLPQPIASAISHIYTWQAGPLNAVPILAAATFITGVAILVTTVARPRSSPSGPPSPTEESDA